MKIGEVIVTLRKQKKVKQKDLADSLEISATYLSLIEHGEQRPSIALIARIADFFDLPVTAILFKALGSENAKSKRQKKYFEAAEPIVDSLIQYLLSGDSASKGKNPLAKVKQKFPNRVKP
jgi:transcriptional regulator with XRE-family HTH domain